VAIFDILAPHLSVKLAPQALPHAEMPSHNRGYAPKMSVEGVFGAQNEESRRILSTHQQLLMHNSL